LPLLLSFVASYRSREILDGHLDTETSLSGHDLEAEGGPVSSMDLAASETQESINVASEATVMEEAA